MRTQFLSSPSEKTSARGYWLVSRSQREGADGFAEEVLSTSFSEGLLLKLSGFGILYSCAMIFSTRVGDVRGVLTAETVEAGLSKSSGVFSSDSSGRICADFLEVFLEESPDFAEDEADRETSGAENFIIWSELSLTEAVRFI